MSDRHQLAPYLDLLDDFLAGRLSAVDFEGRYLRMFKIDPAHRPARVFKILDELFGDVDTYVADDSLREEGDLDDAGLTERSARARRRLQRYVGS